MSFTARRLLTSIAAAAIAILALRSSLGPFHPVNSPFVTENMFWLAIPRAPLSATAIVRCPTVSTNSPDFISPIALSLIALAFVRNSNRSLPQRRLHPPQQPALFLECFSHRTTHTRRRRILPPARHTLLPVRKNLRRHKPADLAHRRPRTPISSTRPSYFSSPGNSGATKQQPSSQHSSSRPARHHTRSRPAGPPAPATSSPPPCVLGSIILALNRKLILEPRRSQQMVHSLQRKRLCPAANRVHFILRPTSEFPHLANQRRHHLRRTVCLGAGTSSIGPGGYTWIPPPNNQPSSPFTR